MFCFVAAILYFQYVAAISCEVLDSLASYTEALWAHHAIFLAQSTSAFEARDSQGNWEIFRIFNHVPRVPSSF